MINGIKYGEEYELVIGNKSIKGLFRIKCGVDKFMTNNYKSFIITKKMKEHIEKYLSI